MLALVEFSRAVARAFDDRMAAAAVALARSLTGPDRHAQDVANWNLLGVGMIEPQQTDRCLINYVYRF